MAGTDTRRIHDGRVGRRGVVAGLAAFLAAPALVRAEALRPLPRGGVRPEGLAEILARSRLGDLSGFVLTELSSGRTIESHNPALERPPASVAKVATAAYAMDRLGAGYVFPTRLRATGPIEAGALRGDLVLEGGGDPLLDTDALGDMAAELAGRGVRTVAGRFLVETGALPSLSEIDAGQPEFAGYNPAISGMNLNFNRAHLEWEPGGGGPRAAFLAPGRRFSAEVPSIRADLSGAGAPRHGIVDGGEVWSVDAASLRGRGGRWLPVRDPGAYSGAVFRSLALGQGMRLPEPETVGAAEAGEVLVARDSPPLEEVLRGMLRWSTNLTAEVVGLRAAQASEIAPEGLAASGADMTAWARDRFGLDGGAFVNHSGLTDRTRLGAGEMARILARGEPVLGGLLRERPLLDARREPVEIGGARVFAKTGTLYFTSALAGYLDGPRGRFAFAIMATDPDGRARVDPRSEAPPAGARGFSGRARAQEQALLRRWAALHAA